MGHEQDVTTPANSTLELRKQEHKSYVPLENHDGDSQWFTFTIILSVIIVFVVVISLIVTIYCVWRKCHKHRRRSVYGDGGCHASHHQSQTSIQDAHQTTNQVAILENGIVGYPPLHARRNQCYPGLGTIERNQGEFLLDNPRKLGTSDPSRGLVASELCQRSALVSSKMPVTNPVYREDSSSDDDISSTRLFNDIPYDLGEIFVVSDRSQAKTIANKLIVFLTRRVDYTGADLYLDNMGISLRVPRGAVQRDRSQLVSLVLNWDLGDNPSMTQEQSLVSPVVYVGPHGLKLEKPCVLSFRHCAFDPRHIRVMRSETELTEIKKWESMCEEDSTNDMCVLTPDECRLEINSFTLFTCIQSPVDNHRGKKWLQLVVFACPLRMGVKHQQIRVYFLNKTPCALQWAIQNEAQFGGKQVCPEKVFLFDGSQRDMFTKTKYVSNSWGLVDIENSEKVHFLKIWHGHCPHISICFKRSRQTDPVKTSELNLQLQLYQERLEDEGEKLVIQIFEDTSYPGNSLVESQRVCQRHHLDELVLDVPALSRGDVVSTSLSESGQKEQNGYSGQLAIASTESPHNVEQTHVKRHSCDSKTVEGISNVSRLRVVINQRKDREELCQFTNSKSIQIIPHTVRKRLKILLDPKHIFGNDWQSLASQLGLDEFIPYLREKESPTEAVLDVAETKGIGMTKLRSLFVPMERFDALAVIDDYLGSEARSDRVAVEHSEPKK